MKSRIILHTADLHVGKNRKYEDYLEQQRYMLEGILALTRETLRDNPKSEVWLVIAGDVFDRNEDTKKDELVLFMTALFFPLLRLKDEQGERFSYFMIDGNHDRQPHLEQPSVLSPLQELTPTLAVKEPIFVEDKRVLLVPFFGGSDKEFKALIQSCPQAEFIVAHECLARMVTDTGWTPPRDQDHYLEINNVITPNIAGIFLGDIHKCQSLDERQVSWYSGSPVTLDHGHKLPKGVLKHYYGLSSDGHWVQDRLPELVPLSDSRIKQHIQLGRLLDPNSLPLSTIADNFKKNYMQMTLSPEVCQLLEEKLPNILMDPLVSWEHDRGETTGTVTLDNTETAEPDVDMMVDYYRPLIEQWVRENGETLTEDEKEESLDILMEDFRGRN